MWWKGTSESQHACSFLSSLVESIIQNTLSFSLGYGNISPFLFGDRSQVLSIQRMINTYGVWPGKAAMPKGGHGSSWREWVSSIRVNYLPNNIICAAYDGWYVQVILSYLRFSKAYYLFLAYAPPSYFLFRVTSGCPNQWINGEVVLTGSEWGYRPNSDHRFHISSILDVGDLSIPLTSAWFHTKKEWPSITQCICIWTSTSWVGFSGIGIGWCTLFSAPSWSAVSNSGSRQAQTSPSILQVQASALVA